MPGLPPTLQRLPGGWTPRLWWTWPLHPEPSSTLDSDVWLWLWVLTWVCHQLCQARGSLWSRASSRPYSCCCVSPCPHSRVSCVSVFFLEHSPGVWVLPRCVGLHSQVLMGQILSLPHAHRVSWSSACSACRMAELPPRDSDLSSSHLDVATPGRVASLFHCHCTPHVSLCVSLVLFCINVMSHSCDTWALTCVPHIPRTVFSQPLPA